MKMACPRSMTENAPLVTIAHEEPATHTSVYQEPTSRKRAVLKRRTVSHALLEPTAQQELVPQLSVCQDSIAQRSPRL
jgi:hypothetical protein